MVMYRLLRVNMASGHCTFEPLTAEYEALGGRALTAALINKEVPTDCDPLGAGNKLIFAPGLLGATEPFKKNLISVSAKSPVTGKIKSSSSSALAANHLEQLGIWGVSIEGASAQNQLLQLEIRQNEARLIPSPVSGLGNFAAVEKLVENYGRLCSHIIIGPGGEARLLTANIACSDQNSCPGHHAGREGLGAVMGSKGLKNIIIFPPQNASSRVFFEKEFKEAAKRFVTAMNAPCTQHNATPQDSAGVEKDINTGTGKNIFSDGCLARCNLCGASPSALPPKRNSKSAELAALWNLNAKADAEAVWGKFEALCNDFGVDAFTSAAVIAQAMQDGDLRYGDEQAAFGAVTQTAAKITAQTLQELASASKTRKKAFSAQENMHGHGPDPDNRRAMAAFADAAGICAMVAFAALRIPEAQAAIADMLNAKYGWAVDKNYPIFIGQRILEAEKAFPQKTPAQ